LECAPWGINNANLVSFSSNLWYRCS
jgi:hypothetical protein